jgi:hypothetical protein
MRRFIVRAAVSAMLVGGATGAFAFSTGPPVIRTNGFAVSNKPKESNCSVCHLPGPVNGDPNGYVALFGVPPEYTAGVAYPIEVHLDYNWSLDPFGGTTPRKWGFQITAVDAVTGDSSGTWESSGIPPDSLQQVRLPAGSPSVFRGRVYLEHTWTDYHWGENQDGLSGPIVWRFFWIPPYVAQPPGGGKVYFFVAGNAANGDSCSICGGDHIYSSVDSTVANGLVSVLPPPHPGPFTTSFERPYPNPMTQCLNLQYEIERTGPVDLSVFDLQGRKVRTLVHERLEPSSYGNFWNGRNDAGVQMKNGTYFIRLIAPGLRKPISYRIALAR